MKIAVIGGLGYVGLVSGACLADLGNEVICTGLEPDRIDLLKTGKSPIYEPGLEDILERNIREGRLAFTLDNQAAVHASDIIFITVGTPSNPDGSANLHYLQQAIKEVAQALVNDPQPRHRTIVNKSTVPIGTGEQVEAWTREIYDGSFDIVSNPEFLREGTAVNDFSRPDRIIIGTNNQRAEETMKELYRPQNAPLVLTSIRTAEMIKYASNAYLATSISFINSLSTLCEKLGADITRVTEGMRYDQRIGNQAFLDAGIGYGGSCFPKDIKALIQIGLDNQLELPILQSVEEINERQKLCLMPKIDELCPNLKNQKVAVWGLAFKPDTDDIREAPSLVLIKELQKRGAKVAIFDPVAEENGRKVLLDVTFHAKPIEAVSDACLLVIATGWRVFEGFDLNELKAAMATPNIADGRNIYDPVKMKKLGFNYRSVGR